jgi:nicotinate-nucleotide adenylyltransferase
MRLGVFGGSFDPVHNAHVGLARACQQQAGLDEIWFMPTSIQPLKQRGPTATDAERIEMLELAISNRPDWRVCTLEIDRGGMSYTVDTLRQMAEELPEAELFFLMGADAVREVPRWKEPDVIFGLATPLVVRRGGELEPSLDEMRAYCDAIKQPQLIEMPSMTASSTELRRRCAAGESIDDLVPPPVAAYIAARNLYR